MKHWFIKLSLFLVLLPSAYGFTLTVPFENFQLFPGRSLSANYTIGIHKIIFCFENNLQNIGIIVWPFQGQTKSSNLPIFLKTDPNFEGEFADNSGIITITNNQNFPLFVSCLFGY